MKRIIIILTIAFSALFLAGCNKKQQETEKAPSNIFEYKFIHGDHGQHTAKAYVIWEFTGAFETEYQVVYTSCECRPAKDNCKSLARIKIDNENNTITSFSFDFFGDSGWALTSITNADYLATKIVGKTKTQLEALYANEAAEDALVAGATVTASNIARIAVGMINYHTSK